MPSNQHESNSYGRLMRKSHQMQPSWRLWNKLLGMMVGYRHLDLHMEHSYDKMLLCTWGGLAWAWKVAWGNAGGRGVWVLSWRVFALLHCYLLKSTWVLSCLCQNRLSGTQGQAQHWTFLVERHQIFWAFFFKRTIIDTADELLSTTLITAFSDHADALMLMVESINADHYDDGHGCHKIL